MDIERFHILTEVQKSYYTCIKGVLLASRLDGNALIRLYSVNNYYVEVLYPLVGEEPVTINAFQSTERLRPFLEAIDIETLFNQ